jgi:hypothetical protein
MTTRYVAFCSNMLHSPLPFGIQALWQGSVGCTRDIPIIPAAFAALIFADDAAQFTHTRLALATHQIDDFLLRCFWPQHPTGYATSCKQSSRDMRGMFLWPVVRTKGRERKRRQKSREGRSGLAKSTIHRKQDDENEQTNPLDRRSQVEDERRRERAVSSSDPQTQDLGKHR